MTALKGLRPNLDELLRQDPKAARKEPLAAAPGKAGPGRPADRERFSEGIAHRHDLQARTGQVRASTLADKAEDGDVLDRSRVRRGRG